MCARIYRNKEVDFTLGNYRKQKKGRCKFMEKTVLDNEAKVILNAGRTEGKVKGKMEGKAEGRAESIVEILEEYGTVPSEIKQKILAEQEIKQLKKWLKLSIKVKSVEEFTENM